MYLQKVVVLNEDDVSSAIRMYLESKGIEKGSVCFVTYETMRDELVARATLSDEKIKDEPTT